MQRNTIVPILMVVVMFGMFVYHDAINSTQNSMFDSVLPLVVLGVVTIFIIISRSRGTSIFYPFIYIYSFFKNQKTPIHSIPGVEEEIIREKKYNASDLNLKKNLQRRIVKMLDEGGKYDEFTLSSILKELENIKS